VVLFDVFQNSLIRSSDVLLHSVSGSARKWFVEHEPFSGAADDFYREWPEFERKN